MVGELQSVTISASWVVYCFCELGGSLFLRVGWFTVSASWVVHCFCELGGSLFLRVGWFTVSASCITKRCLYNFDPLKPHFYTVKLGFTGIYIIFLISAQNIDCGYPLEPPRRGGSNEYPQSMFCAEIWKKKYENFHFLVVKFSVYLNRHIFVMGGIRPSSLNLIRSKNHNKNNWYKLHLIQLTNAYHAKVFK